MKHKDLEYSSPDELIFGNARKPAKCGLDLEIGSGKVIPEINYMPRVDDWSNFDKVMEGYRKITDSVLQKAVNLGMEAVQLETEFVESLNINPEHALEIIEMQKNRMKDYHEEYGLKSALRSTVADLRKMDESIYQSERWNKMLEAFEMSAEGGADILSIESRGGQEVFSALSLTLSGTSSSEARSSAKLAIFIAPVYFFLPTNHQCLNVYVESSG